MAIYWTFTLLLMMAAVGMSLNPRAVVSKWLHHSRAYWLRVLAATFLLPPLVAMLIVAILPLPPASRGGVLLMSVAPGAPMLTRMVSRKGVLFDAGLAASYQIVVGLAVPLLTPFLLYGLGRFYDRHVWVAPRTLAWQVASLQFLPLVAGLLIKYRWPGFAARVEPWMSRIGNLMLIAYLLFVVIAIGRVLRQVGPASAAAAILLAVACLALGHWFAGPTIALSNTNRHVGLAMLIAGLNFKEHLKLLVPFFAAYAVLAPLLMTAYAIWQRRRLASTPAAG